VLVGLAIAVANIDEVIRLIRTAPDPATAREALMERRLAGEGYRAADRADRRSAPPGQRGRHLRLSETQARAILDCACSA
jgi:DNA gyrase subunit A